MSNIPATPFKEVFTQRPIEDVRAALRKIPPATKGVKLSIENDTMNFFQFDVPGNSILSFGVFVEVSLRASGGGTIIYIEGRRKLGTIDRLPELDETYNVLLGTISMIGKALRGELPAAQP